MDYNFRKHRSVFNFTHLVNMFSKFLGKRCFSLTAQFFNKIFVLLKS